MNARKKTPADAHQFIESVANKQGWKVIHDTGFVNHLAADHDEYGHCLCGLYLSREYAASGQEPSSIPERREGGI